MKRYILISVISGIFFAFMDAIINSNSFAIEMFKVFEPIANNSVNIPLGMTIDLLYGFIMAALFLAFYPSLPGSGRFTKGISYGVIIWFFRVFMYAMTILMTLQIPISTIIYILLTGLAEMILLGLLYSFSLKPNIKNNQNL